jgi:hypothetical protein
MILRLVSNLKCFFFEVLFGKDSVLNDIIRLRFLINNTRISYKYENEIQLIK